MLGNDVYVQSTARSSLSDDGSRSDWDKEAEKFLSLQYPGWQNPKGTEMVPSVFPLKKYIGDRGEETEQKIFDLLKNFGNQSKQPMFVVHSHQFSELIDGFGVPGGSRKWVNGEHDFVLIHKTFGPIFIQVKAGCKTCRVYENAKDQLRKDVQATVHFLTRTLGQDKPKRGIADAMFNFPGFVAMPNCPRQQHHEQRGLFLEDCKDVDSFSAWWERHVNVATSGFPQESFEHLMKRFVGLTHSTAFLSHSIVKSYERIQFATQDQLKALHDTCPKQWIVGPAGSGKTWILEQKVLDLAKRCMARKDNDSEDHGKYKILVLCFNRPLCEYFKKKFSMNLEDLLQGEDLNSIIDVMTYDKFLCNRLGAMEKHVLANDHAKKEFVAAAHRKFHQGARPECRYQHIFVDEGQDMYGTNWPELLESFLQEDESDDDGRTSPPLARQHMWIMYDSNQCVQPSADDFQHFWQHLNKSSHLHHVLRNTGKIFDLSKKFYSPLPRFEELKVGHTVIGLDVEWDDSLPDESKEVEGVELLAKHIIHLRRQNVKERNICVLTADVDIRNHLAKQLQKKEIQCQNAEDYIKKELSAVIVESIRRFKGLESKVVIVFDPVNKDTKPQQFNNLLYSAVSRCFCYLIILSTKVGCALIRSNLIGKLFQPIGSHRKRGRDSTVNLEKGRKLCHM